MDFTKMIQLYAIYVKHTSENKRMGKLYHTNSSQKKARLVVLI